MNNPDICVLPTKAIRNRCKASCEFQWETEE